VGAYKRYFPSLSLVWRNKRKIFPSIWSVMMDNIPLIALISGPLASASSREARPLIVAVVHPLIQPFRLRSRSAYQGRSSGPRPFGAAALRLVFGTDHCIKMQCPLPKTAAQLRRWAANYEVVGGKYDH
jgi:hypothetical protein